MARYIDVDKVELKGLAVFDENLDVFVPLSVVRKALQMTPTADVVPKSDVEELKAIIADHKASEERWEEFYSNAKAEVVQEIFEEIECMLARYTFEDGYGEYISTGLEDEFAELKKKYTEEKK